MKSNEELEAELEELRKEFYFSIKNTTANDDQSGGTTEQPEEPAKEEWTTIFDMHSNDPAINLGKTSGIQTSAGVIAGMPDVTNFSTLRIYFSAYNATDFYDFDISKKETNYLRIFIHDGVGTKIAITNLTMQQNAEGKWELNFGTIKQLNIYSNKYPTILTMKANIAWYDRILAK